MGVFVGGTGAANQLEDYEESWARDNDHQD